MKQTICMSLAVVVILACPGLRVAAAEVPLAEQLAELLRPIRQAHKVPALAGAIVTADGLLAVAAVGHRVSGRQAEVTSNDLFHLGSCGKAMTATLLATFVEQGRIGWDTTLADALPDLAEHMHEDYRPVTIAQLLAHRAGLSGETIVDGMSSWAMRMAIDPLPEQRLRYARLILAEPPAYVPGTKMQYANRGFVLAGVIAERVGGEAYETLMARRIFEPLGMTTAGFGPAASAQRRDQPWGHMVVDGRSRPFPPGPLADNPPLLSPAGTIHASLADWGRFIACHLRAGRGEPALLQPETFQRLHRPLNEDHADEPYAFGWMFADRGWADGTTLVHGGSNTINFAVVWMAPRRGFAVLAATNVAPELGALACDDASSAMIRLHLAGALAEHVASAPATQPSTTPGSPGAD